jgi:hypothetical protein
MKFLQQGLRVIYGPAGFIGGGDRRRGLSPVMGRLMGLWRTARLKAMGD